MFNIVLVEPRIPGNVGTIGRLAYVTNSTLHLIKPYGFGEITEKAVKRAGLDYWFDLEVYEYENLEQFWQKYPFDNRHFLLTTKSKKNYFEADFKAGDFFYFGREDAGLNKELIVKNISQALTIPMKNNARSINLANAVSIVIYEAIRQNFNEFL